MTPARPTDAMDEKHFASAMRRRSLASIHLARQAHGGKGQNGHLHGGEQGHAHESDVHNNLRCGSSASRGKIIIEYHWMIHLLLLDRLSSTSPASLPPHPSFPTLPPWAYATARHVATLLMASLCSSSSSSSSFFFSPSSSSSSPPPVHARLLALYLLLTTTASYLLLALSLHAAVSLSSFFRPHQLRKPSSSSSSSFSPLPCSSSSSSSPLPSSSLSRPTSSSGSRQQKYSRVVFGGGCLLGSLVFWIEGVQRLGPWR